MSKIISPEGTITITDIKKPKDQCAVLDAHHIFYVRNKVDSRPQTI